MAGKDAYSLKEIFQRMELDLISSLKRNFFRHKEEELKEGFTWEQWQLAKLRNLVKFRKANQEIIGQYSQAIENTINEALQESYKTGESNVEKIVSDAEEKTGKIILPKDTVTSNALNKPKVGIKVEDQEPEQGLKPIDDILKDMNINNKAPELPETPPTENFFGVNEKKLKALQDSVNNDFKQAQQSILRQMDDVYRQTIFRAHMNLQAGATSLNKAIDMATSDFLDKGINCIVYKNGNRVNIASYAEMALRTASQRATFLGEGKKRDEYGIHLVVVSAHANTCELCLPWQGKVLIDDVYSHGSKIDGDYPLLSEAMNAGLLHPNCRHTLATYFEGITKLPKPTDDKKALKSYEAEQKQRYIERQIRRWKRAEAGSCDPEDMKKAQDKVTEWENKLRQHLDDNPQLRRDPWREQNKVSIDKNFKNDNIVNRGGISGALNPDSEEANKYAIQYYEAVRHMKTDMARIAKNTGWDADKISAIKNHIFYQKHDLGNNKLERFAPSYSMGQSWQRLIEGKNIQPHDITLLNHEYLELSLMKDGYSQYNAHILASKKYNYRKESEAFENANSKQY